jgi:glycogen debranching enzyme
MTAERLTALLERAQRVLDANWRGESTVASRSLYPHQWSWDAAFISIGRSWAEPGRAMQELETMFRAQWANGMLPHIRFDPGAPDYFPGPDFWASDRAALAPAGQRTSGLTQPPLHARAALEVYRNAGGDREAEAFLRRMFPRLVAQHGYLEGRRDPAGHGLAAIVHPWESGLDNSPLWDPVLDAIDVPPGAVPPYRRYDLAHASAADRPSDATYDRYVYLAMRYRDSGYDDRDLASSQFLVEDVLFNTVYLWSAHALVEIAGILGEATARLEAAARTIHEGLLAHLWDPNARRFFSYDLRSRRRIRKESVDSAIPLLDPELPGDLVEAIADELMSAHFDLPATVPHYLVPSYDLSGAEFDRRRYWRGPVWTNTNWMVWRGLKQHGRAAQAREVEESTVGLVERSGFREYFDPFTGEGYGSVDFSWTAALLIDVLRAGGR